jgi:hypothetical protein
MTDFLKDCYFYGFCKGRKNFVLTPRYAKKFRAMRHSAKFFLKFYLRLRSMPLNVKFKSKMFMSTPRYAAQRGVDFRRRIVLFVLQKSFLTIFILTPIVFSQHYQFQLIIFCYAYN